MCRYLARLTIIAIAMAVAVGSARAEVATMAEMELACQNWLAYVVHERGAWAGSESPAVVGVQDLTEGGALLARCFSIAPRGHVVVPVIKELPPIKSYSEDYGIDVAQTVGYPQLIRDVLSDRLNRYLLRYGSLEATQPPEGDVLLGRAHREEWDWLLAGREVFEGELAAGEYEGMRDAGPLLTSTWHQSAPYYNFCPLGNGGARCVVGCVATAAAQIMNYHDWPLKGTGTHSYWWNGDGSAPGQTLSATFRDYYDWANILDDYSGGYNQAQADARARNEQLVREADLLQQRKQAIVAQLAGLSSLAGRSIEEFPDLGSDAAERPGRDAATHETAVDATLIQEPGPADPTQVHEAATDATLVQDTLAPGAPAPGESYSPPDQRTRPSTRKPRGLPTR